jgi:hypothetical protein
LKPYYSGDMTEGVAKMQAALYVKEQLKDGGS